MKKLLLTLCLSLAMIMSAAFAQADSVTWSYNVDVAFKDMTFDGNSGGNAGYPGPFGNKDANGYYDEYRWGAKSTYSSLSAAGVKNGTIVTDGQRVDALTITHNNQSLSASYSTLLSGTIYTTITLTPDGDNGVFTVNNALSFNFYETPNSGSYQNDIFYMTASEIMSSVSTFQYEGETYYVYLHATMQALEGEYLKMAQQYAGYDANTMLYGWTTKEGMSAENAYQLSLVVSLTPPPSVPVPGAVWIMGTGIAGLVAMKRRNKK